MSRFKNITVSEPSSGSRTLRYFASSKVTHTSFNGSRRGRLRLAVKRARREAVAPRHESRSCRFVPPHSLDSEREAFCLSVLSVDAKAKFVLVRRQPGEGDGEVTGCLDFRWPANGVVVGRVAGGIIKGDQAHRRLIAANRAEHAQSASHWNSS